MSLSGHLELFSAEAQSLREPAGEMTPDTCNLSSSAAELAGNLIWVPDQLTEYSFGERCRRLVAGIKPQLADACDSSNRPQKHPQVRTPSGTVTPRIAAVAEGYLAETAYQFDVDTFAEYLQAFQDITVLNMAELWALIPVLKLVLLEQIAERGKCLLENSSEPQGLHRPVRSLKAIRETTWKVVIEPLIRFDRILREDPAGAYSRMDYESRELYRQKLVNISDHSDCSEMEVAREVLGLARAGQKQPSADPRVTLRRSHVGTYLLAEGARQLEQRVDLRAPFVQRIDRKSVV